MNRDTTGAVTALRALVDRWYFVSAHGIVTLCANERDARDAAAEADRDWPHHAPHIPTQLAASPPEDAPAVEREAVECHASEDGKHHEHEAESGGTGWCEWCSEQMPRAGDATPPAEAREPVGDAVEVHCINGEQYVHYDDFIRLRCAFEAQPRDTPRDSGDAEDADLFWNADDGERSYDSIGEMLSEEYCDGRIGVGSIRVVQRAVKRPDVTIRVKAISDDEDVEWEVIDAPTAMQSPTGEPSNG